MSLLYGTRACPAANHQAPNRISAQSCWVGQRQRLWTNVINPAPQARHRHQKSLPLNCLVLGNSGYYILILLLTTTEVPRVLLFELNWSSFSIIKSSNLLNQYVFSYSSSSSPSTLQLLICFCSHHSSVLLRLLTTGLFLLHVLPVGEFQLCNSSSCPPAVCLAITWVFLRGEAVSQSPQSLA